MENKDIKKKTVKIFLDKGILVTPDIIEGINSISDLDDLESFLKAKISDDEFFLISNDIKKEPNALKIASILIENSKVILKSN